MHILKKGHALLTIFFITSILFCMGVAVVRSCGFKKDITSQQYHYWHRYYLCEGCIEYIAAHICRGGTLLPETVSLYQGKDTCVLHVSKKTISLDRIIVAGDITQQQKTVASWELVLVKQGDRWSIEKRNIIIKSLYSF